MRKLGASLIALFLLAGTLSAADAFNPLGIDQNLPVYRPVNSLQGELRLAGSYTMSHVATMWADSFRKFYPDVKVTIEVTGSRGAVSSVQSGKADIGLLSRSIKKAEVTAFQQNMGHAPKVLTPCLEPIGIFVHKDNPIRGLTLQQVDAIFSESCKRGAPKPIRTWGQLGFPGAWATQPVIARGRASDTGSQVFLQEAVMLNGQVRKDLKAHKSNLELIKAIAADPRSVGFAGISYATPGVRAVPLAARAGGPFVSIDDAPSQDLQYPLVRPLQLVVNHDTTKGLPNVQQEFIKYVFSRLGQEDVIKSGFQAIPARPAHIALDSVGLGVAR